jgi:hypothetical protein
MKFLIKILIAFDYLCNAFAPASIPGMTISSHAGMAAMDGRLWGKIAAGVLNKIQTDHCALAMQNDSKRSQAVIDELKPYLAQLERTGR